MHSINSILRKLFSEKKMSAVKVCRKYAAAAAGVLLFTGVMADAMVHGAPDSPQMVESEGQPAAEQLYAPAQSVEIETEDIYRVMDANPLTDIEIDEKSVNEENKNSDTDTEATEEVTEAIIAEETASAVISYSEDDYNNLLRIVEAEATGGDVMSKMLVADVIINRVISASFPNTVTEVIYQGNGEQFQPISDGRFYTVTVTDSTVEAVDRALSGEDYSQGAYFFAATASIGWWHETHLTRLFEYGGHVYYAF